MKCRKCYQTEDQFIINKMCLECHLAEFHRLEEVEWRFNVFGKILDKQSQAISKLAEYVDRINANSKAPFSDDVEEEIKKILE